MARLIGLVRGINVGGSNVVKMADLRAFLEHIGANDPKTLHQSGNFTFEAGKRSAKEWQALLGEEAPGHLGLNVVWYVRTGADWARLLAENPFQEQAVNDPRLLHAIFFDKVPTAKSVSDLEYSGPEQIAVGKQALYVTYPEGAGRSRLSANSSWKKLTATGTARNWNTVLKLRDMLG